MLTAGTGQFVREVFRKYYNKLSMVRLEIVAPSLVTRYVITSDDHESIREFKNTSDKSAIILRAIASHLDVDCIESFTLLLDLMDQFGDIAMKRLAGEINQELNRSSKSMYDCRTKTFFIPMYRAYCRSLASTSSCVEMFA